MTGRQEDSNEEKLCLPLKVGGVEGEEEMEDRGGKVNKRVRT